jgi:hypothetical protein
VKRRSFKGPVRPGDLFCIDILTFLPGDDLRRDTLGLVITVIERPDDVRDSYGVQVLWDDGTMELTFITPDEVVARLPRRRRDLDGRTYLSKP